MFNEVKSSLDLQEVERSVLAFWENERIFDKLREKNRGGRPWSFIDGPITANNPMGVHHAWGRIYKDIYQRFKAMQGHELRYQNGFDCHGLWVEVEVEKELGINSKHEIADYGLDRFIRRCRERVDRYSSVQTEQSKRLGQWMDWDNSYYTMSDSNIEHIWHFLKVCHEKGWLYRGKRAMPWCARCGTSLSQHELADSYKDLIHKSVYVKFPLVDRPGEYILAWTTTPWTLPANTALAVHPNLDYAKVKQDGEIYYLALGTVDKLKPGYELIKTIKGRKLVGQRYRGPFSDFPAQRGIETHIVAWQDVGEEEGTGVVHIAPGCGEEDFELAQKKDLPVLLPIDEAGHYYSEYGCLASIAALEAADFVVDELRKRGLLYYDEQHEHRYPVCWRCQEELVFRLVDEWFISCEELRQPMIEEARKVKWIPDYAGKRMEDWLLNMGDWCISRKRFWGLPLPLFVCSCGEVTVIGSRHELERLAISGAEALPELHRPWIDEVKIQCPKCGSPVSRVPEVGDCWLDAGIVAYSTLDYLNNRDYWEKWFPADLVIEMREQLRLWFYAMLFMSVTLTGRAPYKSVLVYEKVHDEQGRPMHKSWGNAIWLDDAVERMGADVMRWIYAGSNIQTNLNFGYGKAQDATRKLLTLWNVYSFFVTYARLDNWVPAQVAVEPENELDKWVLSRLHSLIAEVTESLEALDAAKATHAIELFIDDLSNWYVRLSRRRFWKNQIDEDKNSAYAALYEVLVTLCKLLAPILSFTAESMYQNLVRSVDPDSPESVHLYEWLKPNQNMIDRQLMAETEAVMKVVRLGRSARSSAGIKVRQPLTHMIIRPSSSLERNAVLRNEQLILDELNIKELSFAQEASELLQRTVKCNPAVCGPKYGSRLTMIQEAIESTNQEELTQIILTQEPVWLQMERGCIRLQPEDLIVEVKSQKGFSVAEESYTIVAVNTELTEDLILEGLARDLIRQIQNLRKDSGFTVDERVRVGYQASGRVLEALKTYNDYISHETLAVSLELSELEAETSSTVQVDGQAVLLQIKRAD